MARRNMARRKPSERSRSLLRCRSGVTPTARRTIWRRGFAAREVALVVALLCILLAIGLPYIYRQRSIYRRQICETRQYRLAMALVQHAVDDRKFPGYRMVQARDDMNVDRPCSWVFPVLPYLYPLEIDLGSTISRSGTANDAEWVDELEREMLIAPNGPYAELHTRYGPTGDGPERGKSPKVYIPELICPANAPQIPDPEESLTSFVANCGMPDVRATATVPSDWRVNGVFTDQFPDGLALEQPTTLEFIEEHDGLTNVLMLSENVDAGRWTDTREATIGFVWTTTLSSAPVNLAKNVWPINFQPGAGEGTIQSARPSSHHLTGFNVAYCDASTRFITSDIDPQAWSWMMMTDSSAPQYPGTSEPIPAPIRRVPDGAVGSDLEGEISEGP